MELRRLKRTAVGRAALFAEGCLATIGVSRPLILLLLGHMRSGSSLVLHVLLTNPEVTAMGERNALYAHPGDFARFGVAMRLAQGLPFKALRYVVDQVNHNALTPDDHVLRDSRVRILFILREPEATITSLLKLSRHYYENAWSVSLATDYYVDRLARLTDIGHAISSDAAAAFIRYESLTQQPTQTLEALSSFLGLARGFSASYPIHSFTRTRGDPGPLIASGRIVPNATVPAPELSGAASRALTDAYRRCEAALARFSLLGT